MDASDLRPHRRHRVLAEASDRLSRSRFRFPASALLAIALAAATLAAVVTTSAAQTRSAAVVTTARPWVAGWAASPVVGTAMLGSRCPAGTGLHEQTVRNVVFLSAGGDAVRVRLTNTFGARPVLVGHASVAVQAAGAAAVPATTRTLTFRGRTEVTVAAGGHALSDPVGLRVAALSNLLVSVYAPGPTGPVTDHPFTAQTNYLAGGDQTLTSTGYTTTPCWMLVDGVDVRPAGRAAGPVVGTVVALGDSITDTTATTADANQRWPDHLARRLDARAGATLSVVNAGLVGNRILAPREGEAYYGVPALARLDRDVFAQTAVRDVIVLEGVNDIGFGASAEAIVAGLQQIAAQAHARGVRVFGATIMPFGGSIIDSGEREAVRNAVNTWIRTGHAFDAVFDFAQAVADPVDPHALYPPYDSGDHLHPNDAGCRALAGAVDLQALR